MSCIKSTGLALVYVQAHRAHYTLTTFRHELKTGFRGPLGGLCVLERLVRGILGAVDPSLVKMES